MKTFILVRKLKLNKKQYKTSHIVTSGKCSRFLKGRGGRY
jgi:hypothetical protein